MYGRSSVLEAVHYPDKLCRPALEVCTEIHLAFCAQTISFSRKKAIWNYIYIYIYIYRVFHDFVITAGGDFLGLCDEKSSYKHVSDFGRLRSYDRLKLRIEGKDY
jgi:hypothetical protein